MGHGYPILLSLAGRRVLIVGGGRVAARKAAGVLGAGADDVTAVSPRFDDDFPASPALKRLAAPYEPAHMAGAELVFAATDSSAVNARVVADARAAGALVCRADAAEDDFAGDFSTPAQFGDANLLVTASAGSAALSARVRDALRAALDARYFELAAAMNVLRPWVRGLPIDQSRRAAIFRTLAGDAALGMVGSGKAADANAEILRALAVRQHPEIAAGADAVSEIASSPAGGGAGR